MAVRRLRRRLRPPPSPVLNKIAQAFYARNERPLRHSGSGLHFDRRKTLCKLAIVAQRALHVPSFLPRYNAALRKPRAQNPKAREN